MAHRIVAGRRFVEVIHTGPVGYGERVAALDELGKSPAATGGNLLPVLIDLSAAQLIGPTDEAKHERADYIARATLHPVFHGRRVAMVGIPVEKARSAIAVAAMRQVRFSVFQDREQAIAWLMQK